MREGRPLVDVIELLDQRIDANSVERERLHVSDNLFLEAFLNLRSWEGVSCEFWHALLDMLDLQAGPELLVVLRDTVEGFEHARLQSSDSMAERETVVVHNRRHSVGIAVGLRSGVEPG